MAFWLSILPPVLLIALVGMMVWLRYHPHLRSGGISRFVRVATVVVVLLCAVDALAWLGRATVETPADFRFINRGELTTLDPNRMSWMQDIRCGYALWEGLYALDPKTLQPIPGAAERIEVSDDKLTWTFHMRRNGRWTNGDPVTSHDFLFAWRRMLEQPGDYTYLISKNVKGADAYLKAVTKYREALAVHAQRVADEGADRAGPPPVAPNFDSVAIKAPDPETLVVTTPHPVTIFPDLVAFPPFWPLNEKSMEAFKRQQDPGMLPVYDKRFTRPPNLVTNGPFRLETWHFKKKVRLVANKYYWDAANVRSKTIDIISAEDPMAQYLIYNSGRVDWLTEVSPEIAADLRKQGRKDLKVFDAFGTYFYTFNCKPNLPDGSKNPFADVRVRQALTMALDKRPIVENVTRMGEKITTVYIPRGVFPGYESPAGLEMDRQKARQLLSQAGFPGGRGLPRVTLLYNTGASHDEIAQIVRRQWLDTLGIDISLDGLEINAFRQRLHNKEYAIARASWYGDYNDPSTFTDKYLSDSENNDSAWVNHKYDQICAQAAVAATQEERLKLFAQAEAILIDEAPILPMYHYVNTYLVRDHIRGIPLNVRNMVNFKSVWAERE